MPVSAVERKLNSKNATVSKKKGVSVKRAQSFSSTSAPTSPNNVRKTKQPALEPRYTKSTYLLIEAKRMARELEERKKKGSLLTRPFSAKSLGKMTMRHRSNSNDGSTTSNGSSTSSTDHIRMVKKAVVAELTKQHQLPANRQRANSQHTKKYSFEAFDSGRFIPLRNSGRRKQFIAQSQNPAKVCAECGTAVKSGFFSEHQGLLYCNVPCYTSLFNIRSDDCDDEILSSLSEEQKQLRTSLLPKLRTYNSYYSHSPCQICCKEINDKFVLEGVLKVYWGLKSPVTLVDSPIMQPHYWKHLQSANENGENVAHVCSKETKLKVASMGIRPKHPPSRYNYKRKAISETSKKRLGCTVCSYETCTDNKENNAFIPPYGTPTTLRITNHVKAPHLIDMLFKKFQIKDNRKRFTLFTLFESGGQKRISTDSFPLLTRLNLGPCEDVAKIFIMESADQTDIPLEVAQYINFSSQVLQTFVQKFHEEEEREVERIKEKYQDFRSLIVERLAEMQTNSKPS